MTFRDVGVDVLVRARVERRNGDPFAVVGRALQDVARRAVDVGPGEAHLAPVDHGVEGHGIFFGRRDRRDVAVIGPSVFAGDRVDAEAVRRARLRFDERVGAVGIGERDGLPGLAVVDGDLDLVTVLHPRVVRPRQRNGRAVVAERGFQAVRRVEPGLAGERVTVLPGAGNADRADAIGVVRQLAQAGVVVRVLASRHERDLLVGFAAVGRAIDDVTVRVTLDPRPTQVQRVPGRPGDREIGRRCRPGRRVDDGCERRLRGGADRRDAVVVLRPGGALGVRPGRDLADGPDVAPGLVVGAALDQVAARAGHGGPAQVDPRRGVGLGAQTGRRPERRNDRDVGRRRLARGVTHRDDAVPIFGARRGGGVAKLVRVRVDLADVRELNAVGRALDAVAGLRFRAVGPAQVDAGAVVAVRRRVRRRCGIRVGAVARRIGAELARRERRADLEDVPLALVQAGDVERVVVRLVGADQLPRFAAVARAVDLKAGLPGAVVGPLQRERIGLHPVDEQPGRNVRRRAVHLPAFQRLEDRRFPFPKILALLHLA